jgi:xanthine/uracil permease
MAEAAGQTVLNAEIVGKDLVLGRDVSRTIRGDALTSLLGGLFGAPLLVNSGENVGIVRVTGVRSRYVTATAGVMLVVLGLLTPVARVIDAIPASVVGGTSVVVYAIITVMGVQMLRAVDFSDHANTIVAATALAAGLLPTLIPGLYHALPTNAQILLGSGVAVTAFTGVVLNFVFHHVRLTRPHRPRRPTPTPAADPEPRLGNPASATRA